MAFLSLLVAKHACSWCTAGGLGWNTPCHNGANHKRHAADLTHSPIPRLQELLGRMPRRLATAGKYARDFFNRAGELRHIKKLHFWPLDRVLVEKYHFQLEEVGWGLCTHLGGGGGSAHRAGSTVKKENAVYCIGK